VTEGLLRRRLGILCAALGLLHFLPAAFVWLSSGGPSPVLVSGRSWSYFYYAHFILLAASGLGLQAAAAARSGLFYGGPLIDFLLGVTGFMVVESLAAHGLGGGPGRSWLAVLPGLALIGFGARLAGGRPLLGS
jgi:hypothetical protein